MQAGIPIEKDQYVKTTIEGIPFYVHKDMEGKSYLVDWNGIWLFGNYSVVEE